MEWYGDDPDITKWAILLEIAYFNDVERIVHVAMWTDQAHHGYPDLNRAPGATARDSDLAPWVADHFRKINGVRSLATDSGIAIEIWPDLFTHGSRDDYFRKVREAIVGSTSPTLWFFDPDTGLEPESVSPAREHITLQELSCLHAAAPERNHIAVYQHNTQRTNWPLTARRRLQAALNRHAVQLYRSPPTGQAVMLAIS